MENKKGNDHVILTNCKNMETNQKQTVAGPSASDPLYLFGQKDKFSLQMGSQRLKSMNILLDTEFEDKEKTGSVWLERDKLLGGIRDSSGIFKIFSGARNKLIIARSR